MYTLGPEPVRFNVILIDCPWRYESERTGGSMKSGASQKYDTMSLQELADLAPLLRKVVSADAYLFLWRTTPLEQEAMDLLKAWADQGLRFKFKSKYVWVKSTGRGLGSYRRVDTEDLLVCLRGSAKCWRSPESNVLHHPRIGHSVKPDDFYRWIEEDIARVVPPEQQRRLELFAVRPREGWTSVGLSIDGRDIREVLTEMGTRLRRRRVPEEMTHGDHPDHPDAGGCAS